MHSFLASSANGGWVNSVFPNSSCTSKGCENTNLAHPIRANGNANQKKNPMFNVHTDLGKMYMHAECGVYPLLRGRGEKAWRRGRGGAGFGESMGEGQRMKK